MPEQDERFSPSQATLSGENADVYFLRTRAILEAEDLNPLVTMEVFCRQRAVLAGMHEVRALLERVLPADAEVWGLEEGTEIEPLEVVLRIRAPYRSFAIYETAYLGILAHETGWATAARACVEAASPVPVISFGARHVHPDVSARMEYAAIVGGCAGCATPAGARLAGIKPSGTLPHALILCMGDTLEAVKAFDRHIDPAVNRIALVDTFKDEVEESLRVAEALGDRLWGVRLDTPSERGRVTADLVREVRAKLDLAGFRHVKIVVSGGIDPERIRYFREAGAPVDAYGVGSAISGAPPVDFTADIKEIEGRAVAKRGRLPGITPNPRLKRLELQPA
ncbi:MAG: nicotinate phosphoribosyltransferase [Caldilineae bacterium]|nr:MAG: nicotinate phosphoribosyltransferase [Caldilineae bacterium]